MNIYREHYTSRNEATTKPANVFIDQRESCKIFDTLEFLYLNIPDKKNSILKFDGVDLKVHCLFW